MAAAGADDGGWGVVSLDLAEQWATAIEVDMTIDGVEVDGRQQQPTQDLTHNCGTGSAHPFWVYYRAIFPELVPGLHHVTVTFHALRALPDGYGKTYGPGQILQQTFRVTAE